MQAFLQTLAKDQLVYIAEHQAKIYKITEVELKNHYGEGIDTKIRYSNEEFSGRSKKALIEIILFWIKMDPALGEAILVQFENYVAKDNETNETTNRFGELCEYMLLYITDEFSRGIHLLLLLDCIEARIDQKQYELALDWNLTLLRAIVSNADSFREEDLNGGKQQLLENFVRVAKVAEVNGVVLGSNFQRVFEGGGFDEFPDLKREVLTIVE